MEPRADVRINARLDYLTYLALQQLAESEQRSLNGQLSVALAGWLFGNGPEWYRRHLAERQNAAQQLDPRGAAGEAVSRGR